MAKTKPGPPKRSVGQPPFVPTNDDRFVVVLMAALRFTHEEMVQHIINPRSNEPISPVTLRKVFAEEIQVGYAQLKLRVIAASVRSAEGIRKRDAAGKELDEWVLKPDTIAQIWLQKILFGFRETTDVLLPPPAEGQERGSIVEAARRVAFALAKGAHLAQKP